MYCIRKIYVWLIIGRSAFFVTFECSRISCMQIQDVHLKTLCISGAKTTSGVGPSASSTVVVLIWNSFFQVFRECSIQQLETRTTYTPTEFQQASCNWSEVQKMTRFHRHITHIRTHNLYVEYCTSMVPLWWLTREWVNVPIQWNDANTRVFASSAMFTHAWVLSMSLQFGTCPDGSIYQSSFGWQWRHWSTL